MSLPYKRALQELVGEPAQAQWLTLSMASHRLSLSRFNMSMTALAFPSQIQAASCIKHNLASHNLSRTSLYTLSSRAVRACKAQMFAQSRQLAGIQVIAASGTFMELK
jgi:hypothetical protein